MFCGIISCGDSNKKQIPIENKIGINTSIFHRNLNMIREYPIKLDEEIYRSCICWSWGQNPFGGGLMVISVGKKIQYALLD